jgi:hypothetical protein
MATMDLKVQIDPGGLLTQVKAMAKYLDGHEVGKPDPFVDLAREIGEVNIDTDITFATEKTAAGIFLVCGARGDLARLLDAFKAVTQ